MAGGEYFLVLQMVIKQLIAIYRHIFTGIAAYFNLTWAIWLRYCRDGKQDDVQLVWPSVFTSVPVVVRVENESRKLN
jgi:dihydroceramidase